MADGTRLVAARERLTATFAHLRRLAQHPRGPVAVDGGLLGVVLLLVGFDIRSHWALVLAVGVIGLHLTMQRRRHSDSRARAHDASACDEGQG